MAHESHGAPSLSETPAATTPESQAYLPDFCAASTVFVVVLIAELVAIVLALASFDTPAQFLSDLWKISFFVLWFAVLGLRAHVPAADSRLEGSGKTRAFVLSFLSCWHSACCFPNSPGS